MNVPSPNARASSSASNSRGPHRRSYLDGSLESFQRLDLDSMNEQEMREYKRLKNRLAARNCRKRRLIVEKELRTKLQGVTKEYTKLIVERYQLECHLKASEEENSALRRDVDRLYQVLQEEDSDHHDDTEDEGEEQAETAETTSKPKARK